LAGSNANAGVASASAGASSTAHLVINLIIPSFSLSLYARQRAGGMASQTPCHVHGKKFRDILIA
jgi:hypothetical protein